MNSVKSNIVVAPGCPPEVIQELLSTRILPSQDDLVVLLPPGNTIQYDHLMDKNSSAGRAQLSFSPAQRFFSPRHLKWLWDNLGSAKNNLLLIVETPYEDPSTALVSLTVLILSGKGITLLFPTPEAALDLNGRGFSERWISQKLNLEILAKELSRIFWFVSPWSILYLLMFGGLILRRILSDPLKFKSREVVPPERSNNAQNNR